MYLKTTQKYFAIRNKFSIVNDKEEQIIFAENHFKLRRNCTAYLPSGSFLFELQNKTFSWFGKFFIKDELGNEIGELYGRPHKPFIQKWYLDYEGKKYILRSGGYHCKIYNCNDNWKYDKVVDLIGTISKQVKIRDTYEIDFEEDRLSVYIAGLCMLWMDCHFHYNQH